MRESESQGAGLGRVEKDEADGVRWGGLEGDRNFLQGMLAKKDESFAKLRSYE